MGQIVHLDFRTAQWQEIATSLFDFRDRAHVEGSYAYIAVGVNHSIDLVEKLIVDLHIEDYTCLDCHVENRWEPLEETLLG